MSEEIEETTLSTPVWIGLIVITMVSFWVQAKVTEDRFVPALNVIANFYHIPDDVAGATLMAAGASSPELFSSITALFITKSSLGLGTIVGSEIFNQLIICAGAVFATRGGLVLDPTTVLREVFFYALSIFLLYLALQDARPDPDDPTGEKHIYISFHEACFVFAGYIAYVLVCANTDAIVACCSRKKDEDKSTSSGDGYGSINGSSEPLSGRITGVSLKHVETDPNQCALFLREAHCDHEPVGNFKRLELMRTATGEMHPEMPIDQPPQDSSVGSLPSTLSQRIDTFEAAKLLGKFSDGRSLRNVHFLAQEEKPSNEHGLLDIELNHTTGRLSCFMWQRSYFYDKARFAIRGWHLRWFTLTPETISSVPNRAFFDRHRTTYPHFHTINFDEERLIIRINNPNPSQRNFYLLAPSKTIFSAVLSKMDEFMSVHGDDETLDDNTSTTEHTVPANFEEFEEEVHESLIEYHEESSAGLALFLFLFPVRLLMHWTIPDVRLLDAQGNPLPTLSKAYTAVVSCLLWLIVGSYAMVSSLEHLADWLDIPTAVVGVTVSAAGTSLPNYVASKIAAEKGFGSMAVSNAFGSNTFNIMVGLGLPWVLYTSFGTHFKPYHGLRDEGITESVLLLGSMLSVFVVAVLQSGFVLYRWHAILFVVLYAAYIGYEIGLVFYTS